MTITSVHKDPENLTMTIVADFDAAIEKVWDLWENPRQLERWWGPPTYPATVTAHDFSPGGSVTYFMTGPEGERHNGYWRVRSAQPPHRLEFEDGFADETGSPNPDMPVIVIQVTLSEETAGGTHMVIESTFPSAEAMDQLIAMGMEEGMAASMGQMDDLLLIEAGSQ
jgi:uncharacterized protein YndB with AHSA1/START domain